ncbi:MAG: zf-HC2 domain-containing protein [Phycisphaerales bacterium]|nr:zf-HC2 domain-containing protein [Phycisphaerales bacterium]
MLTCKELIDFLVDYTDGHLGAEARAEFDRHLRVCPSCRAYLDTYQRTVTMARQSLCADERAEAPASVPRGLVNAILEARKNQRPS